MSFASEAAKLLTNKYFLYFIAFLAASNVIGYLVSNKPNAVVFFVLICILAYNFSKNMAVVLIIAIIATNLLMVNKSMREGFTEGEENMDTTTTTTTDPETTATTDPDTDTMDDSASATARPAPIKQAAQKMKAKLPAEQQEQINTALTNVKANVKANAETKKATATSTTTPTTEDGEPVESFAPAGAGYNGTKRGAIGGPAKAARIDYSTTLEQAYDNLEKMLGSDGLNNLSADTNKLMSQQQKLFSTVDKMLPMIDKAQGMLQGLDMDKINSLVGMTEKFSGIGSNISGGLGKLMGSTPAKQ
jgi:hypothetical protein